MMDECLVDPSCLLLGKWEDRFSAGRMIKNTVRQAFLRHFQLGVILSTLGTLACLTKGGPAHGWTAGAENSEGGELRGMAAKCSESVRRGCGGVGGGDECGRVGGGHFQHSV